MAQEHLRYSRTLETRGRPWRSLKCLLGHFPVRTMHPKPSRAPTHKLLRVPQEPWWGQEWMPIPCARTVSLLPGQGTAAQHPACWKRLSRSPSAHASHSPLVSVPCAAWRRDSGLITDGWGQLVTSTHGSSAHTRDLCSHSSPCPQSPQPACSYGNGFGTSKRLKIPLHQGRASVGWGEREDSSVGVPEPDTA